jgi:hypothetical protein
MKTIKVVSSLLTVFLIGIFFSTNSYAKEPVMDYPDHAKQVKQILEQTVKFPDCSIKKGHHGEAVVVFSLSDQGMIQIDEISANCKALEDNLKQQLTGLYFKGVIHPYNQHYRVKFTFLFC